VSTGGVIGAMEGLDFGGVAVAGVRPDEDGNSRRLDVWGW